jgi:hypothetical protein
LPCFGIATDDGVLIATYLQNSFKKHKPQTSEELHRQYSKPDRSGYALP